MARPRRDPPSRLAVRGGRRARGGGLSFSGVVACRGEAPTAHQRDRRNLTPDQLALVMGRHYNRTKRKDYSYLVGNQHAKRGLQKEDTVPDSVRTDDKLAAAYGVGHNTIERNGKFAAAVETLKDVDPTTAALTDGVRGYRDTGKAKTGTRRSTPTPGDLPGGRKRPPDRLPGR